MARRTPVDARGAAAHVRALRRGRGGGLAALPAPARGACGGAQTVGAARAFARHRLAARGALQHRFVRRWAGAELAPRAVALRALRHVARRGGGVLLLDGTPRGMLAA